MKKITFDIYAQEHMIYILHEIVRFYFESVCRLNANYDNNKAEFEDNVSSAEKEVKKHLHNSIDDIVNLYKLQCLKEYDNGKKLGNNTITVYE